jgi:hypothetical protein
MAWSAFSVIPKASKRALQPFLPRWQADLPTPFQAIVDQMDRDTKVKDLVETMNDVFAFVKAAEPLRKIESHEKIVLLMTQQVTDCAYFIGHYAEDTSFCTSLVQAIASSPNYLYVQGCEP